MKTRIVLYGENDKPISVLGDNPQEKVKKIWDAVIALLATHTDDIMRVESVEVWDSEADTPQMDCETCRHYKLACELFSEVCKYEPKANTPQTEAPKRMKTFSEGSIGCSRCEYAWDCPDRDMPHAIHCNNYGKKRKGGNDDTRRV